MIFGKDFTQTRDLTLMLFNNKNRKRFRKRRIKIKRKVNVINALLKIRTTA